MGPSFNEQFDQHGAWRRAFAQQLKQLAEWMSSHELMDASVQERLQRLESQVRTDKVMVAFVAEFSRGKSELINAIFFADYGRRIMPASAGRTTMCPTELGYDAEFAPSLRLLPIETRLQMHGLAEWRMRPDRWHEIPLDVNDADQIAKALEKVAEVRRVSLDNARALGFWHDDLVDENPIPDANGLVEVPMWRHAIINIPHPLLKQGLVILDTPGLNAVGAEPELTVNLIPQAHAVVFILSADTGVTRSDLSIWREHLATSAESMDARLVVLNKIDTLWDTLNSAEQIQAQMDRQRSTAAEMLGVAVEKVVPVSAQKGLVAKITADDLLLETSGLPVLEEVLAKGIMGQRQAILRAAVATGVAGLRAETARVINIRRRDLDDQMAELRSLRGKNASVIESMRQRIEQEQHEFDLSASKIQAVRAVHLKLLRDVFQQLGSKALKVELAELAQLLQQKGLKLGVKKIYVQTFDKLRGTLDKAQASGTEIQAMLGGTFRQLNAEFGFSLQVPPPPQLEHFAHDLSQIEQSHLQYLGLGNSLKLAQPEFSERLVRALAMRLRTVYESAANDLELWSKSATAQLDAQLRERRRSFARRMEAVDRIQQAASGLVERIAEIEQGEGELIQLEHRLQELTSQLIAPPDAEQAAAEESPVDVALPL
ncbi:dynamin family protein [Acidovorax sp. LjRoot118]|uniref:dynamin family protein n=1 Tax=unclassified Acidovorax TaxID=2684926 RepID=UPI00070AE748|nr:MULTISPECIES: dynamin family protein [unclassified Acidovorax]KRC15327.1 dynamin family protein [Acidovorax sp. Root217]KRC32476.1 dynamin family protein [Acidovorax sp. Root219]MDP4073809.1 dynamin family protein [Acidovorax sp. A1169]